jgi:hypothetical protein
MIKQRAILEKRGRDEEKNYSPEKRKKPWLNYV